MKMWKELIIYRGYLFVKFRKVDTGQKIINIEVECLDVKEELMKEMSKYVEKFKLGQFDRVKSTIQAGIYAAVIKK